MSTSAAHLTVLAEALGHGAVGVEPWQVPRPFERSCRQPPGSALNG